MPLALSARITFNRVTVSCWPSEAVGSSMTMILALTEMALAISIICLRPMLSAEIGVAGGMFRSSCLRTTRAALFIARLSISPVLLMGSRARKMFCATVRFSIIESS